MLFLELDLGRFALPCVKCGGRWFCLASDERERTTAKTDPPSGDDKQEKQKQMIVRFDGVCQG